MPDSAQYSFLGWMRRGAVGMAGADGLHPSERLSVTLDLEVKGEGEQNRTESVGRKASLFGPGDVTGIRQSAVVRTEPRPHVRNFEPNLLVAIEFYDEDFPWRYTPLVPDSGKLKPWLWLAVLAEEEFTRRGILAANLPVIEIPAATLAAAFPDPDTTWAWAHVHLNSAIPAQPGQIQQARTAVRELLDENPNLGCSRLLSPRRLKPNTRYTAFLIPAFEKGRLSGLGRPESEIDQTPNAAPAWPKKEAAREALLFPAYYEWEFSTGEAGDFESLARALQPFDPNNLDADSRLLDIQEPGWGLRYRSKQPGRKQPGAVAFESALRVPGAVSQLAFGNDPADRPFSKALADLLNLAAEPAQTGGATPGTNPFFGSDLDDDPIVLPPLYGSFVRRDQEKKLNSSANPGTWYDQANLNPVYRAAAGQGAVIVRDNQEEYADRAWDQLRQQIEARSIARRWQFSWQASGKFFAKRLESALTVSIDPAEPDTEAKVRKEVQMFRAVNLTAPMHAALKLESGSFTSSIRGSRFAAAYTPAFTKVTRGNGPLMRRVRPLAPASPKALFFSSPVHHIPITPTSPLRQAISEALSVLEQPARRAAPPTFPPNILGMQLLNAMLLREGLAGLTPCKKALEALQRHLQPVQIMTAPAPAPNNRLYASLAEQLQPSKTIPARMRAILNLPAPASPTQVDRIELPRFSISFPEPMYRPLADRSPGYILPGIEHLPPNSVTMLEPNPAFIDAYLLGLNHEMAREFLWRELPIDLSATFFRQFWDVRDNPDANRRPDQFREILPILQWGTTPLGSSLHRPGGASGKLTVVVIRGELFRRYPQTEVFMQKAAWISRPDGKRFRQADTALPQNTRKPLFSARLDPDFTLLGFQLDPADARGNPNPSAGKPGWYFALKERAGDLRFGLDIDPSPNDPSWPALAEVPEHQCINAESPKFKALPRYGAGSDKIAAMLYQKPFVLYVHASRLLPST